MPVRSCAAALALFGAMAPVTLVGAAPAPLAATQPAAAQTLLVLGDSVSAGYGIPLAQGWVALLAERLIHTGYGYHVVNASVSGETTAGALARLPHILSVQRPALVLVELGGNDGLRGLPVAQTSDNLERIVHLVQDSGASALLIGMRLPSNYGPEYTERFAAMYASVAHSRHVPLVPFLLAPIANDETNFQADRIHPIAAVQPKLLDTVWPVLEPLLHGAQKAGPAP
jgi:acyl-CoA thioesterase-1